MTTPLIEITGLDELRRTLSPQLVDAAVVSTLNKTAVKLRTAASRDIRSVYNVRASAVAKAITLKRARKGTHEALILGQGERLPLKEFGARQTRQGVTVMVKKKGGRKRVKSAFLVESIGGNIFRRVGKPRLPIEKLFGPAIPQMFSSPDVMDKLLDGARREAPRIFEQELKFRLGRQAGVL